MNHNRMSPSGHHDHHAMMEQDFKQRFFVSIIITIPILILSPTIQDWLNITIPRFTGYDYILFGLATIIALYGGWPFYTGAKQDLERGVLGMMVLVSIAVGTGYLFSAAATFILTDVVDFYWEKAQRVGKSRDTVETGAGYSYIDNSYYKKIDRKGRVENIDSMRAEYFYSWGKLDSSNVLSGDPGKFKNLDLSVPDILNSDYIHYFYPNDTGGADLAIGFDTEAAVDPRPVGLLAIDRERYVLRWMYLFYPHKANYQRYSRSFRFVEVEGLIFPDSIWEVGAKRGIFFSEHYRLETEISGIKVYRDR